MKFILGKKIEMTQLFDKDSNVVPATKVFVGQCTITQIKKQEKDGYNAIQIGFDHKKNLSKALKGHLKDLGEFRYIKEFRHQNSTTDNLKIGDIITIENFKEGEKINIIGTSKGKGYQGVVRRHGFHGHPATHGHKDQLRMPGSIGSKRTGSVAKGKRMAGHMGNEQITVKNLEIIKIDLENNIIYLKGAIPGSRGSLIEIVGEGEIQISSKQQVTSDKENKKENDSENVTATVETPETPVETTETPTLKETPEPTVSEENNKAAE